MSATGPASALHDHDKTYYIPRATKLFFAKSATKGGGNHPLTLSVWLKISYNAILRFTQHIFRNNMVYLDVKFMTAN